MWFITCFSVYGPRGFKMRIGPLYPRYAPVTDYTIWEKIENAIFEAAGTNILLYL